jgi:hypothetical protein
MFLEILFGTIVVAIILYLWLTYLTWANVWNDNCLLYQKNPSLLDPNDRAMLDSYPWIKYLLLPQPITDSASVINFWITYYWTKFTLSL